MIIPNRIFVFNKLIDRKKSNLIYLFFVSIILILFNLSFKGMKLRLEGNLLISTVYLLLYFVIQRFSQNDIVREIEIKDKDLIIYINIKGDPQNEIKKRFDLDTISTKISHDLHFGKKKVFLDIFSNSQKIVQIEGYLDFELESINHFHDLFKKS